MGVAEMVHTLQSATGVSQKRYGGMTRLIAQPL
jgi:hypothetical protein